MKDNQIKGRKRREKRRERKRREKGKERKRRKRIWFWRQCGIFLEGCWSIYESKNEQRNK
jgi:hypothetical protein